MAIVSYVDLYGDIKETEVGSAGDMIVHDTEEEAESDQEAVVIYTSSTMIRFGDMLFEVTQDESETWFIAMHVLPIEFYHDCATMVSLMPIMFATYRNMVRCWRDYNG